MKAYRKWLVTGIINNKHCVIASFNTKSETQIMMNLSGFKTLTSECFEDSNGNLYYVTKNVKEYD